MCRHTIRWLRAIGGIGVMAFLTLSLGITVTLAHGEASLTVTPAVVSPNGVITVSGEEVEDGEIFVITLETTTFTVTLGTVTVEGESFQQEFTIPDHVPPGSYQVRATSAEGEVLSAELTVEAGAAGDEQATALEPSSELMELDRSKPTVQLVVIVAGIAISAGLGVLLVRAKEQPSGA